MDGELVGANALDVGTQQVEQPAQLLDVRLRRGVADDGLSFGDFVAQLTFLLFQNLADEQSRPPFNKPSAVPKDYAWARMNSHTGNSKIRIRGTVAMERGHDPTIK